MRIDVESLARRLPATGIGCRLVCREVVDSTNRVAAELARTDAPEGTVVIADRQTAGRGRLRRGWQSPPGCNLYLSIVLRPAIPPGDAPQLTLLAGVAVAEALAFAAGVEVGIKWPNDLLAGGRKLCGILAETGQGRGGAGFVIVGIGLNVNIRREDFDAGHRERATSLREETGRDHGRSGLLLAILAAFGKWYGTFLQDGFPPIRERWLAATAMTGKRIRVLFRDELTEGVFAGIDCDGALLIADQQGDLRRVAAGDATIMKG